MIEEDNLLVAVELDEGAQEELAREELRKKEEALEDLANAIQAKFTERSSQRGNKESQWLRGAQLYYGKLAMRDYYTKGESPFEGVKYRDRPDVNIVRSKCNIAIAQTVSMQFGGGNKNWDLWPSKESKDPQNTIACGKMSDVIETQLEQSKYALNCRKAMWDRVILGTGVLKGPRSAGRLTRGYEQLGDSGTWVPSVTVDYAPTIDRINPWFFYPDETTEDPCKLEDCIEIHPMSALDMKKLLKHPGFRSDAIKAVLEQPPEEYRSNNWADFARLSENNPNLYRNKYAVLEYHGPITKVQLDKLGISATYESINDEYYGEVWVCQGQVLRIELSDIEASYSVPYYICNWEKDPGSVFGFGVPLMMEDAQRVVNQSWHMILDNSALSSGPQVAMQKGLIEPANGEWNLNPGQIWYLTDPQATVQQALQFFTIPNVAGNITPIMQMAQAFAEEESGIPLITAGLNSPEVSDTATGELMIRTASTTLLDFMSEDWDDNITTPIITNWYAWNMQYNPDPEIKGAFSVDVRTSTEYKNKQLHIRDLEKLSVESANNPELAKRVDQGALARMRLEMMNLPTKEVIKSEEQVLQEEEAAAANAMPPPELLELQLKARELGIKEAELNLEAQQIQQREIWEHEERMAAASARLVESQARVAVSQNEKETEMLKLMQRDREAAAKLMSSEKIARENNLTKTFEATLKDATKQRELQAYESEIDLARNQGSGI